MEISITYVEYPGNKFACVFVRDQSDELKDTKHYFQQELDKLKAKEAEVETFLSQHFVYMVCHQFRTPLNIISFSNSLIKEEVDKQTQKKIQPLLDHIQQANEQISHMLDDMMFLAKAEAAKLNLEPKPLNIVQFCHDLVAQIQMSNRQNSIIFLSQCNRIIACLDKKFLEPILKNLLENAMKYSPNRGAIYLKISDVDEKVIFQVKDRGIGIPVVDQQRLFEPFYRGTNVNNIPGNGLGLSILKTLVDLHGGQVAVESEVGRGTTFTVMLPSLQQFSLI